MVEKSKNFNKLVKGCDFTQNIDFAKVMPIVRPYSMCFTSNIISFSAS